MTEQVNYFLNILKQDLGEDHPLVSEYCEIFEPNSKNETILEAIESNGFQPYDVTRVLGDNGMRAYAKTLNDGYLCCLSYDETAKIMAITLGDVSSSIEVFHGKCRTVEEFKLIIKLVL